jgi:hypothetical protein
MNNKDLFKQAIAEAKTIREAAITNAKEALEESITPHLKEMLAQKLQEMEKEGEEDKMDETVNNAEAEGFAENPGKHGNLEEAEEEEEETPEEEAEEGEEDEELDLENMTKEEFTDLVLSIVAQETGHEEEELGQEDMPVDDMTGSEEEIDINELLAELEGMDNKKMDEYTSAPKDRGTSGGKDTGKELDTQLVNFLKTAGPEALAKIKTFVKGLPAGAGAAMRAEGTEMELDEYTSAPTDRGTSHKDTGKELDTQLVNFLKTAGPEALSKIKAFVKGLPAGAGAAMRAEEVQEELNEALTTIKSLRGQLQEVNLLNAKLLYVNKVFKSNNLSEGQKVNVIAAFDKAETVREVKLVFETVSKNVVAKKVTSIKEHTSFASKPTGTTKAPQKEVINEVSEQVLRMQKLAGIIK